MKASAHIDYYATTDWNFEAGQESYQVYGDLQSGKTTAAPAVVEQAQEDVAKVQHEIFEIQVQRARAHQDWEAKTRAEKRNRKARKTAKQSRRTNRH